MKKWIFLSFGLIVLLASGITVYILSQPSGTVFTEEEREERLEKLLGRDVSFTNSTPQGDSYYEGNAIYFEYPAKAEVYEYRETSSTTNSNALDDFSFDLRNPRAIFNLKVAPANASTIDDIPAVRLRELRAGEYKKGNTSLDGVGGVYYHKEKDDPEISAFYLKDGNLYTISITGTEYSYLKELFDTIVSSAKLK